MEAWGEWEYGDCGVGCVLLDGFCAAYDEGASVGGAGYGGDREGCCGSVSNIGCV